MVRLTKSKRFWSLTLGLLLIVEICAFVLMMILVPDTRSGPVPTVSKKSAYKSSPFGVQSWDGVPTWKQIEQLPALRLSFDPSSSSTVNLPAKGQITTQIDPNDISELPKTIDVYEMLPICRSEKEFAKKASRLGVSGNPTDAQAMNIVNGKLSVSYNPLEDKLSYNDYKQMESHSLSDVPTKEQSKKIAWKWAKEKGLLVPGALITATNHGDVAGDDTSGVLVPETRDVVIGVSVGGYDVGGPGMSLRIKMGSKGKVETADDCLRRLKLIGTYKLKPLEQALDEAAKGQGTMNLQPETVNPTIKNVSIFYYAQPPSLENRVLLPVYAFMSNDCCIYVPAFGEPVSK
jgi:hypothetical protein